MFYKRDIYGNMGVMSTSETSIPEMGERQHYKEYAAQKTTDIETAASSRTIPVVLFAMVVLLWLLSR